MRSAIVHPDYENTGKILLHDIAILILDTSATGVRENPEVSPICLPAPGDDKRLLHRWPLPRPPLPAGTEVMVAGWGVAPWEHGVTAGRLQEIRVKVTEAGRCKRLYRELGVELPDTILCADIEAEGEAACQGDSGAGLLHRVRSRDQGAWTQVGVVSAGIGCGAGLPGLYTRVSSYLDWIQEVRRQQENLFKL